MARKTKEDVEEQEKPVEVPVVVVEVPKQEILINGTVVTRGRNSLAT